MLKSIELIGFKSFADKTRFEFPAGVTVVVGPNGSGKSNVVDAIKWVLGTQSAKALRGKEMTDVIFAGSKSRKPLNTAEVTITIDNRTRTLAVDTEEVLITRRVYRSGEGEYFINHAPSRLKDIRNLFAGTGVSTDAYSIIEQGRVDSLLQSSSKERRKIFEEAAGISRFRSKKEEAFRRLERIDQNLLRLSDIVDEVETRLRTTRGQAGKAARYREQTNRLKELRTTLAFADWSEAETKIVKLDTELVELQNEAEAEESQFNQICGTLKQVEEKIDNSDQLLRSLEASANQIHKEIVSVETSVTHHRTRSEEISHDVTRLQEKLFNARFYQTEIPADTDSVDQIEQRATEEFQLLSDQVAASEKDLHEVISTRDALRESYDQKRSTLLELQQTISRLQDQFELLAAEYDTLSQHQVTLTEKITQQQIVTDQLAEIHLAEQVKERQLSGQTNLFSQDLQTEQTTQSEFRSRLSQVQKSISTLQGTLTGARERVSVMDEFQTRLEGLNNGVKSILQGLQSQSPELQQGIHGVVADLIQVDVDSAPLVESALGPFAQYLVLNSRGDLLEAIQTNRWRLDSRVGFFFLDDTTPYTPSLLDLSNEAGVIGRCDHFVDTDPRFDQLMLRLLGKTWIVTEIEVALRLSQTIGSDLSYVSTEGEYFGADGSIVLGMAQTSQGVISRRSELRAFRQQIEILEKQNEAQIQLQTEIDYQLTSHDQSVQSKVRQLTEYSTLLAEQHQATVTTGDKYQQAQTVLSKYQAELEQYVEQLQKIEIEREANSRNVTTSQQQIATLEHQLQLVESQIVDQENAITTRRQAITDQRVESAKKEQKLAIFADSRDQRRRAYEQHLRTLRETNQLLEAATLQHLELQRTILQSESTLATHYLQLEQQQAEVQQLLSEFSFDRESRFKLRKGKETFEKKRYKLLQKIQVLETKISKLQLEQSTLSQRMLEDYELEISAAVAELDEIPTIENRKLLEHEIERIRQQAGKVKDLNFEALNEIEELEERFELISKQYQDLTSAKNSLLEIVARINADSRELFTLSLDTIRGHFQELFRKLFGGGHADIIIDAEEGTDVLEAGIEIVACPPGKELRSITLLSGGEKTLTCVALLLAVFRSRPSPFCILDEVDAALDEANVGRFTNLISESMSTTQFVVITHSKKTMTAGNTLYGVTMQESGVSKLVSVQFEDVTDEGHIKTSAILRARDNDPPSRSRAA